MTVRASILIALFTLATVGVSTLPSSAGESRIDGETGLIVPFDGYGRNAAEYLESPPIEIIVNEKVFVCPAEPLTLAEMLAGQLEPDRDCDNPQLRDRPDGGPTITALELERIMEHLEEATAAIESVPHARIRFEVNPTPQPIDSWRDANDGLSVVTLVHGFKIGAGNSGQGSSWFGTNASGERVITNLDVRMDTDYLMKWDHYLLLHELMHGIGVNHSWLTDDALTPLELSLAAPPSIMSYGGGWDGLCADDAAVIARMYPDLSDRLSRTTGTVRGVATDDGEEIYGAGVYLVDANDAPVAHRLTGFGHVAPSEVPEGATSGLFELDGVAPGTYDLLIASKNDPDVILGYDDRTGGPGIWGGEDLDAEVRPRGWVRRIEVQAGEIVDLGEVHFGEDREFPVPAGGIDSALVRWSGAAHSWYWFDVWNADTRSLERSGWTRNRSFAAQPLPAGRHAVKIWGWNGSASVVIQNWAWTDFTPAPTSFTWDRPFRLVYGGMAGPGSPLFSQVEPVDHYLFVSEAGAASELVRSHGGRYTRVVAPAFRFDGTGGAVDTRVTGFGAYHDGVWVSLPIVGP